MKYRKIPFLKCVCLHQGYGLTETASTAAITEEDDISVGRVGAPLQGMIIYLKISISRKKYTISNQFFRCGYQISLLE